VTEPNLEIIGGGRGYDALVALITVAEQRVMNYGVANIIYNVVMRPTSIVEMIEVFGGDNFDEKVQTVVVMHLIPELGLGLEEETIDGPSVVVFAKNILTHIQGLGAYV